MINFFIIKRSLIKLYKHKNIPRIKASNTRIKKIDLTHNCPQGETLVLWKIILIIWWKHLLALGAIKEKCNIYRIIGIILALLLCFQINMRAYKEGSMARFLAQTLQLKEVWSNQTTTRRFLALSDFTKVRTLRSIVHPVQQIRVSLDPPQSLGYPVKLQVKLIHLANLLHLALV